LLLALLVPAAVLLVLISVMTLRLVSAEPQRSRSPRSRLKHMHRLDLSHAKRNFWGKVHYLREKAERISIVPRRAARRGAMVGDAPAPRRAALQRGGSDAAIRASLPPSFDGGRIHLFLGSHRSTVSVNVSTFVRSVKQYDHAGADVAPTSIDAERASKRLARRERKAASALAGVKKMMALSGGKPSGGGDDGAVVADSMQWDDAIAHGSARLRGGRGAVLDPTIAPLLVFVHVPKAGGSTVKVLLRDWAAATRRTISGNSVDFLQLQLPQQNALSAEWGHRGFGLHRQPEFRNKRRAVAYFTVLREPRARIVSQYHFALQRKAAVDKGRGWAPPPPSFRRWFREERASSAEDPWHPSDNPNVRQICCWWTPFAHAGRRAHEECPPSEATLACAKRNLARFAVVGIMEEMDAVVEMLALRLGVTDHRCPEDRAVNAFKGAAKHVLDADERALVDNATRFDRPLYEFGRAVFAAQRAITTALRATTPTPAPTASAQHYWGHEATLRRETYARNYAQFVDSAACVAYNGQLHRWRLHAGTVGEIYLQLYRPVGDVDGGGFALVHSEAHTVVAPGAQAFQPGRDGTPLDVQRGDCIGWYAPVGGMVRYDFPPSGVGGCKTVGVSDNVRVAPAIGSVFHPRRFVRWHFSLQAFVAPAKGA
jgi:hypothetical protein